MHKNNTTFSTFATIIMIVIIITRSLSLRMNAHVRH